jgi:hypothetical protein
MKLPQGKIWGFCRLDGGIPDAWIPDNRKFTVAWYIDFSKHWFLSNKKQDDTFQKTVILFLDTTLKEN